MISVYGTVLVSVAKTISAVGVLHILSSQLPGVSRWNASLTYTVVTTGAPNMDMQAKY